MLLKDQRNFENAQNFGKVFETGLAYYSTLLYYLYLQTGVYVY